MMNQLGLIVENSPLTKKVYQMKVKLDEMKMDSNIIPGQFYYLQVQQTTAPLLRRPISVHDVDMEKQEITFIYRVEGEGTKIISQKMLGDQIDLLGPLGNGFQLKDSSAGKAVLIGGGVGIPPLYYLGKQLIASGIEVVSILGFQSLEESFLIEQFSTLGKMRVATMDGSYGVKGTVLDVLQDETDLQTFYSCGPKGMLKAIQKSFEKEDQIEGYFSLEERMGCGVGACYGCIVKVNPSYDIRGYKKVCSDGPVFPFREVIL